MPVEQVEDLPVVARNRRQYRSQRQAARSLEIQQRELAGLGVADVVVGLVDKRERGSEILGAGSPGCIWLGCTGWDLFSAQALPPAERKHEGPHPAGVLQAAGKRVGRDKRDLGSAYSPRPVAEQ